MGSLGQRAAKLLAVKVGGLKKKSGPLEAVGLGSIPGEVESFTKFDGW